MCISFLPCGAVFANDLTGLNDSVRFIAWALIFCNTCAVFVHVGALGAATAVHRHEADAAGVVRLPQEATRALTGGHVIPVH